MVAVSCFWLMLLGIISLFVVSLGIRSIHEISWHELKAHSKRYGSRERFDAIHDEHDDVSLRLEATRTVCHLLTLLASMGWMLGVRGASTEPTWVLFVRLALPLGFAMLAATVWLPAAVERFWGTTILYRFWKGYSFVSWVAIPFEFGAGVCIAVLNRLMPGQKEPDDEDAFEEEILAIVTEGLHDGHLDDDAREMIEGVIELGDANVADIMTSRSNIEAYPISDGWNGVFAYATEARRTRIPVYEGSLDKILGILYVKDLLAELQKPASNRAPLRSLLRDVWSVPLTRPLDELLQDFLRSRSHMAMVVDEYNGVAGLVTIEDVLEEIVGEIVDEDDEEHVDEIRCTSPTTAEIRGRAHLADINERLGIELPDADDFETIAGLTVSSFGRIPVAGESFDFGSVTITVLESNRRRVERVLVESRERMVQVS